MECHSAIKIKELSRRYMEKPYCVLSRERSKGYIRSDSNHMMKSGKGKTTATVKILVVARSSGVGEEKRNEEEECREFLE